MRPEHQGIGMTSQRTRQRLIDRLRKKGIRHQAVLEAMRNTPRHIFVDEALASRAYEETALPIGHGQTISQPYTVARMTEALLEGESPEMVLEIGTGSGYQCAILAQLVRRVYSVERIAALLDQARLRFRELGLRNIRLKHSDGGIGLPEYAPFDAILVTAAPMGLPQSLLDQLAVGGRLVIPIQSSKGQVMVRVTRTRDGFQQEHLESANFVPLMGGMI
ncbi:MAG: protein-L-isoaspartate(D-aspartate) O-methyltransferase [Candidatus Thiodiazotropha endolucinida]|uniref:Protein-L-isoaspartate O-methyltransferase n=2 Tax=Candidatus Thiodiazotropha TaxID=1913444 RepID=A0A7Z1AET2_9GAMM|nr:protein-L-isoaspartate(D-aspartate) O-methyltransferase [Candidatus Thiodiazotropha endolucinida]MBT3010323.1 protein-L-isoaspartate(D-aspartate) O-methyltransferase [Candidatus Thiodiazotropha sp. (ex Lucina pensylvanica)]MBT3014301.1 protein-L-isoaspartate(D-aspartate) O-methyltransferase [Candidatus Thiodiazotropha taylori]MBT3037999.1 protein-L-isoaspartate(D-aspartate) O-methyltransferase [Candidatus Thiodiazotropha sp. (ex Codakia orbicularis)]MBV2102402.1 protein-L-isoaspartate(D-aspa